MALAREWHPDLILLDVMMPGEDGFAVAERIRDDPELAGVRVLFLTARADIGDNERSRSTGAVGHVTKPFNPSSLGDEIRAALDALATTYRQTAASSTAWRALELEALDHEPQQLGPRHAPELGPRRRVRQQRGRGRS